MRKYPRLTAWIAGAIVGFLILNVFGDWVSLNGVINRVKKEVATPEVKAMAQYTADSGILQVGTNLPVTAAAASGNTGSYQGTLASDSYLWNVSSTGSGVDQELVFDGSAVNNANKFIIAMTAGSVSATLNRLYQICDWTSSTGVDTAADSNCTTGGWRTLNTRKTAITTAASTAYVWHIYDGYWSTAANTNVALSTPLSNFVNASNGRILVRAYSTTNCNLTCTHFIDYARVDTVVDPIYMPSGMVTSSAGLTVTGDYRNVNNALFVSPTASDNNYAQVAGSSTSTSDFYFKFTNVRTYTGMNTILVRAEYSCTATGINHRPKIYNFASSTWEDLTATSIACATADTTSAFAKNNVSIADYISSGEVRIGWRGLSAGTQGIRVDQMYIIMGSVNDDSSKCEISFGTGTATNCTNTRTLDTTAATSSWTQTSTIESTAMGAAYYPQDNDGDAVASEYGTSANLSIPTTVPAPARITGLIFGMNWSSATTTMTAQPQFKDLGGSNVTVSGGWTLFGTTNAATTYTYEDSVTNGYFASNPDDYVDVVNGLVNVRVRTSVSTATAGAISRNIDFVFTSAQWAETTPSRYTLNYRNVAQGDFLPTGVERPISSAAAGTNTGGWQGTLAPDAYTWTVSSTGSGLDQELYMDAVEQNSANKLIVSMTAGASNTTLSRLYQICDFSSSVGVDNAADSNCTTGGWRTMNTRKTGITTAASTAYVWHIYDGYWSTAANTNVALSTPVSNFINTANGRVLVRAFSATSCATTCTHFIDYMRVDGVIDSIYEPAGMTTSSAGLTVTGDYRNANNALFQSPTASDNQYAQVAGSATSTADFYFSFKNVKTYTNMNTIMVRAEYSCTATGINHRPKIYNFASSTWEDLTSTSIACSATDTTSAFAKSNINEDDYISNGEIRVGWRGLSAGTQGIRVDMIYIILGSVNDDSSKCEISFGTGTATNCTNTRTLDTTAATSSWQQTSEAESTALGHAYYAKDNDGDATSAEHASSANLWIPAGTPAGAEITGRSFALNYRSSSTAMTSLAQYKDQSGFNATVNGGWTSITSATNALATYTYFDSVTIGYFNSNADDYVDTYNSQVNVRFNTSVSTAVAAVTRDIDFIMSSIQWVAPPSATPVLTLTLDTSTVSLGNLTPGTPLLATTTATVEVTNLTSGYQLLFERDSVTSTVVHSDTVTTIADYTDWDSVSPNSTASPGTTFAFRVSTSTANYNSTWWGSGTALFGGIPAVMETIMNCTSCNSGVTTSSVSYRVNVGTTQKVGTYSGTATYTALSNP